MPTGTTRADCARDKADLVGGGDTEDEWEARLRAELRGTGAGVGGGGAGADRELVRDVKRGRIYDRPLAVVIVVIVESLEGGGGGGVATRGGGYHVCSVRRACSREMARLVLPRSALAPTT